MPDRPLRLAIASPDEVLALAQLHPDGTVEWVTVHDDVEHLLALVESAVASAGVPQADAPGLTERETQILDWIAQGLSNREIAERAYVSINSVKTYIRSAYRKIGAKSRSQAVAWAVRRGYGAGE
ncbi:helix-turn-helix domain-containing protein [Nocardioides mangrovi]|uniref:Helix-turn-helix transcriptional regulator n=1 Tax=Nocardioides mangrovi TaxID=2874580 RepID=A0ABS7UDX3_9ACTN|nr:helix-turn-helix transcriptional regulator [Nocardioides mangrovi]MBZ5739196.1 helix-turn-helix transcriptional regulator [Nocardioides mangrovi]